MSSYCCFQNPKTISPGTEREIISRMNPKLFPLFSFRFCLRFLNWIFYGPLLFHNEITGNAAPLVMFSDFLLLYNFLPKNLLKTLLNSICTFVFKYLLFLFRYFLSNFLRSYNIVYYSTTIKVMCDERCKRRWPRRIIYRITVSQCK